VVIRYRAQEHDCELAIVTKVVRRAVPRRPPSSQPVSVAGSDEVSVLVVRRDAILGLPESGLLPEGEGLEESNEGGV